MSDLFVYTPTLTEAAVQLTVEAPEKSAALRVRLCSSAGEMLVSRQLPPEESAECRLTLPDAAPWDTEHPNLYRCIAELLDTDGAGTAQPGNLLRFPDGFVVPGGRLLSEREEDLSARLTATKLPYIGYAAPESLQRQDAAS